MSFPLRSPNFEKHKHLIPWQEKLSSIQHYIKKLKQMSIQNPHLFGNPLAEEIFRRTLERLSNFGDELFKFAVHGITGDEGYRFEGVGHPENDIAVQAVLHPILDQMISDLVIIERAFFQRIVAGLERDPDGNPNPYTSLATETLPTTDGLAWYCKKIFNDYLVSDSTILTYIHQSARIRTIPYAPVAFIGITASVGQDPLPRLAIPHEFGHYLYWNGRVPRNKQDKIKNIPRHQALSDKSWLYLRTVLKYDGADRYDFGKAEPWLEEIFADVIGCVIGGPLSAWSIQEILLTAPGALLITNDGVHPPPILRPYIYFWTLKRMGMPAERILKLESHWLDRIPLAVKKRLGSDTIDGWKEYAFDIIEFHLTGDTKIRIDSTIKLRDLLSIVDRILADVLQLNHTDSVEDSLERPTPLIESDLKFDSGLWSPIRKWDGDIGTLPDNFGLDAIKKAIKYPKPSDLSTWEKIDWNLLFGAALSEISPPKGQQIPDDFEEHLSKIYNLINDLIMINAPINVEKINDETLLIISSVWKQIIWFNGWVSQPERAGSIPDDPLFT